MGTVPPENKGTVVLACMPAYVLIHLDRSWPCHDCIETNDRGVADWTCLTDTATVDTVQAQLSRWLAC